MVRGLKFQIYEVEGLYYLYSKNDDADQLHGYCAADLRLMYSHMRKSRFSYAKAHMKNDLLEINHPNLKTADSV